MDKIEDKVNTHYSNLAKQVQNPSASSCCDTDCCTGAQGENQVVLDVNKDSMPSFGCNMNLIKEANLGLGEVVIDLGSGPGHDLLQAARQVGEQGHAYGVDFSAEMIALAQSNAKKLGLSNVSLIQAPINDIPLDEESADVIISNCVVNLVEDKQSVFEEAHRLLRENGRLVISDLITTGDIERYNDELWCACIGGATSVEQYVHLLKNAGFSNIEYQTVFDDEFTYLDVEIPYKSVTFVATK